MNHTERLLVALIAQSQSIELETMVNQGLLLELLSRSGMPVEDGQRLAEHVRTSVSPVLVKKMEEVVQSAMNVQVPEASKQ